MLFAFFMYMTKKKKLYYRIRGRLGSLLMLSVTIGILFGFISGTYLTYYLVPKIFLPLPLVFFALFIFFPETPQYFIQRKSFEVMYTHRTEIPFLHGPIHTHLTKKTISNPSVCSFK